MLDKFLNLSFKFGKIFSSVLLILLLFSIIVSSVTTIANFKKVKLEVPTYQEIKATYTALKENKTENIKDKEVPEYIIVLNEIAKDCDLNDYGKGLIFSNINSVQENVKLEYTKGLKSFLNEYYLTMKSKNKNVTGNDLIAVTNDYKNFFEIKYANKQLKESNLLQKRIVGISTLLSSILLFILCLLIPLMIKIEENTRK